MMEGQKSKGLGESRKDRDMKIKFITSKYEQFMNISIGDVFVEKGGLMTCMKIGQKIGQNAVNLEDGCLHTFDDETEIIYKPEAILLPDGRTKA